VVGRALRPIWPACSDYAGWRTARLLAALDFMIMERFDVIIVGGRNAAQSAVLAAREQGASVAVLERAPIAERGGNSAFTAGGFRVVYNGVDDLLELIADLREEERQSTDFGAYSEEQYFDDMAWVTEFRADPDLVETLVRRSYATLRWMRSKGVMFVPMYRRQAFNVGGKFWGSLTVDALGGGPGLVDALYRAAERDGVAIFYETAPWDCWLTTAAYTGRECVEGEQLAN
jgi:tricarballylate dehydrogenase